MVEALLHDGALSLRVRLEVPSQEDMSLGMEWGGLDGQACAHKPSAHVHSHLVVSLGVRVSRQLVVVEREEACGGVVQKAVGADGDISGRLAINVKARQKYRMAWL